MLEAVSGARQLGASSPALAETLDAFGQLMERQGRPADAEPAYVEARTINRRVYGEGHPLTSILGARIANLRCQGAGPVATRRAAEADLRTAISAIDGAFRPGEPVRLKVHSDLGLCLARLGDRDKARAELESNFETGVSARGAAHPMVQVVGRALAAFHEEGGDSASAARVRASLSAPPPGGAAKR
jgi:hypothetical protein